MPVSIACPSPPSFPLLAAVYRAPFGRTDFSMFLCGKTGVFKSALAAVCQQHFGLAMDAAHLPAHLASTANALEMLAFHAKDALLVVDDFAPTGRHGDDGLENVAERLFRAVGNSNAIQGNALTAAETKLVIEQGITITENPLKDYLETIDHYDAILYVRELASEKRSLIENDLRNLHRLTMQRSRPDIAGRYADLARYVRTETERFEFPSPAEIPALMGDFAAWLGVAPATAEIAFAAHRCLVDIHPFKTATDALPDF